MPGRSRDLALFQTAVELKEKKLNFPLEGERSPMAQSAAVCLQRCQKPPGKRRSVLARLQGGKIGVSVFLRHMAHRQLQQHRLMLRF